jgi:hypothetical protein
MVVLYRTVYLLVEDVNNIQDVGELSLDLVQSAINIQYY